MTETKREREEAQARARERLQEHRGRVLYTLTDYGRGETDYVRVFVAPAPDTITEITFDVARAAGRRLHQRGIAFGGGGYSKGLEAADDAARAISGEAVDQLNGWLELR